MTRASEIVFAFNRDREPERVAMKYAAMAKGPFPFLRGTCHLFYQRLTEQKLATGGPAAWICGDLHLENFGTYLGDNALTYFDVNDYDEAALAPCTWDILRLVTSLYVAAASLKLEAEYCEDLARALTETWRSEVATGKPRWIERKTADGIIGSLMDTLKDRRRDKFLDKRSVAKKNGRRLLLGTGKALPITEDERTQLQAFCKTLGKTPDEARFFQMLDAARRIAGTGSLGIPRYVLLIEGKRSPDDNVLLDLKESRVSSLIPYSPCSQPRWPSEAERIVAATETCQAIPPQFLRALAYAGKPHVLKELQPTDDRLDLITAAEHLDDFRDAVLTMGKLAAWALLRSTGRSGSATAGDLIAFAQNTAVTVPILASARTMADLTLHDWEEYAAAYETGLGAQHVRSTTTKRSVAK